MKKIILAKPLINIKESSNIINSVLKSNFINEGSQTRQFEKKYVNYLV